MVRRQTSDVRHQTAMRVFNFPIQAQDSLELGARSMERVS